MRLLTPAMLFVYLCGVVHPRMQIKAIEDYIDLGQIEEVIEMVKDEIELSEAYVGA
jgi:hypothetical protein